MTLTRRARITGAVLCAALALVLGVWIVRDLTSVDNPLDLLRLWTTGNDRGNAAVPLTTTLDDLVLFLVYVTVGVAALRSPVAAAALVAAGVITLAVRLPRLWVLSSSWMGLRASDELRTRALYFTFAAIALGVGLLITAVAGRRRARPGASAPYTAYTAYTAYDAYAAQAAHERTPTRPTRGVSVLAFVLLSAAAGVLAAWEVRTATRNRGRGYPDRFTGSESMPLPLLGTPPGWLTAVIVVLALVAAFGALFHAVYSRPLGLVVAAFLLGAGGRGVDTAIRNELLPGLGDLPTWDQLLVLSWLFELTAGAVLVLALARRGESAAQGAVRPSGYGYGYPQGGGTGPPPPSSPPPGW
ncbi:hypothetical protein ACQEVG_25250 [Streptomyces sp. CA-135486]|uniref:hypothetical protein n=1 Tax=Streptomyces sp. CA-135486 TaxID=3240049 RepID=UPI003D927D37